MRTPEEQRRPDEGRRADLCWQAGDRIETYSNPDETATIPVVREYRGQVYRLVKVRPYTRRRDGTKTSILYFETACADCGALFLVSTPESSVKFEPNRRCQVHKHPGKRVKVGGG